MRIEVADTFAKRLVGLMGREAVEEGYGLFFPGTSSVHSCFMRCAIDVIYLDDALDVVETETLRPWRVGKRVKAARHVLECAEGAASSFEGLPEELGDRYRRGAGARKKAAR